MAQLKAKIIKRRSKIIKVRRLSLIKREKLHKKKLNLIIKTSRSKIIC